MQWMQFQGPTFTLQVPSHWTVTSTPQFQAVFMMPLSDGMVLRPNVTISMRPVQEGVTAADVAATAAEYIRESHPDVQIIDELDFGGGQSRFYRRFAWYDAEHSLNIMQTQSFAINEGVLYVITTTSTGEEDVELIFADMVESFDFS